MLTSTIRAWLVAALLFFSLPARADGPPNIAYSNTQIVAVDAMANATGQIVIDGARIKMLDGTPCIVYNASKPLFVRNCVLVSAGDLIRGGTNCNVTAYNTAGYHIPSSDPGQVPGRFFNGYRPVKVDIQHCYLEGTCGILVDHWGNSDGTNGNSIRVQYNKARNIDGRSRAYTENDGNGNYEHSQFFQVTNTHIANIDVSFNECVNLPGQSRSEDVINIYNSGGTPSSHARYRFNYLQGSYPYPVTATYFSGTGVTTDGDTDDPAATASYNDVTDNWIISVCNSGFNIATGHDNLGTRNTIVNSGVLPDGTLTASSYCGVCVYNSANRPVTTFYNNVMQGNTIGYMRTKDVYARFDQENPPTNVMPTNGAGNTHLLGPITLYTEQLQREAWDAYQQANGFVVGLLP